MLFVELSSIIRISCFGTFLSASSILKQQEKPKMRKATSNPLDFGKLIFLISDIRAIRGQNVLKEPKRVAKSRTASGLGSEVLDERQVVAVQPVAQVRRADREDVRDAVGRDRV